MEVTKELTPTEVPDVVTVRRLEWASRLENFQRGWYKFSRNPFSLIGLGTIVVVIALALLAPWVSPYPKHAGPFTDFAHAGQSPSLTYLFGTDMIGRDILSRVIFALRPALTIGILVLSIVVPVGVFLGLLAGYARGSWVEVLIMRVTDVFVAVPALILALAIASVLTPNLTNAMLAITVTWWPWYTRLVYGLSSSLRNEDFVKSAELIGASKAYIISREILPNCLSPIFTKMSLDMGYVILIGSALSFVGLGEQAPKPGLGTMVADGSRYLPDQWWIGVFPALAIVIVVLGFNLLGDGLRDLLASEST